MSRTSVSLVRQMAGQRCGCVKFINASQAFAHIAQQGELEHRRIKRYFKRTNKGRTFINQMARHSRREAMIREI
jgi:hypothetical protein